MLTINGPDGLYCHSHCFPLTVKELEIFTFSSHTSSNKILSLGLHWLNFQQKFRTEGVFRERRSPKQKRYWELERLFIACTRQDSTAVPSYSITERPGAPNRSGGAQESKGCTFLQHTSTFFFLIQWGLCPFLWVQNTTTRHTKKNILSCKGWSVLLDCGVM